MEARLKNNANEKFMNAKVKSVIVKIVQYLVLTLIAVFLAFPFFLLVMRSFMTQMDINAARIIHSHFTLDNYRKIFAENNYALYIFNTLKVVVFNMIFVPLSASLCAYSFARLEWKGRELVFSCVLATIMIPGTVLQIPLYSLFYKLGWQGNLKSLTIPAMFGGGAINIFLLRQFLKGIPKELDEAATIDGANIFKRYLLLPLVYLSGNKQNYTLAVVIYTDSLSGELATASLKMAAGAFMALFPTVLFILYQRKLIDGIMVGAVKG